MGWKNPDSQGVVCCRPGLTPRSYMCGCLVSDYMAASYVTRTALSPWLDVSMLSELGWVSWATASFCVTGKC